MSRLEELQRGFARGLVSNDTTAILGALAPTRLGAAGGLGIYRNHFLISLEDALAATFPAIRALVGLDYFAQAARRFVRQSPPDNPCLHAYGESFPDFLDGLPEACELPYLGDVARLEWAVNAAYHAPDAPALRFDRLERTVAELLWNWSVELHPSAQLLTSRYPVTAIWRTAQPDSDADMRVDLGAGGENVLVLRIGNEVGFRRVPDRELRFLAALFEGCTVSRASLEACEPVDRFVASLAALFKTGAVVDVIAAKPSTKE